MYFQNHFREMIELLLDWDTPQEAIADELSKLIKFDAVLPADAEIDVI